jgi:hypothetical protein
MEGSDQVVARTAGLEQRHEGQQMARPSQPKDSFCRTAAERSTSRSGGNRPFAEPSQSAVAKLVLALLY